MKELSNCHDCGAKPGEVHKPGCDVERCSVCGGQLLMCGCDDHDEKFARWTGIWPGAAEAQYMGIGLNDIFATDLYRFIFIKPIEQMHTAYEWNKILEHGIIDYDGFRDGDITTETKMTEAEFRRRAIRSTRMIVKQKL